MTPDPAKLVPEIYRAGHDGRMPPLPTDLTSLDDEARKCMSPSAWGYLNGGAGTGATAEANRDAFSRRHLVPRVLRACRQRDLAVSLLGQRLPVPVLLAPVAAQTVAHPDGELASARAAAEIGVPLVLSTASSYPLEDVAKEAGDVARWFQFYWPSDRLVAESLVRRAQASGYTALVVTVDTPALGYRPPDLDNGYLPFLHDMGIANFTSDPVFRAGLPANAGRAEICGHWESMFANPGLSWADLPWLRNQTSLPILIKGILHPDDARRAMDLGADGVVVSNHGGRQLDGAIAALDALPAVRAAIGTSGPVLLDSGIRTGTDVVKALSLGANAILYGRPYMYGLALGGQRGVRHVLRCLLAEIDLTLAMIGCPAVTELSADWLHGAD
jgi:isopentenyl diphosphate isomerase/L-lactate dehydrogenase-like FMN-dependent dehydrogenase